MGAIASVLRVVSRSHTSAVWCVVLCTGDRLIKWLDRSCLVQEGFTIWFSIIFHIMLTFVFANRIKNKCITWPPSSVEWKILSRYVIKTCFPWVYVNKQITWQRRFKAFAYGGQVSDTNPRTKKIKVPLGTHRLTMKKHMFISSKPFSAVYLKQKSMLVYKTCSWHFFPSIYSKKPGQP